MTAGRPRKPKHIKKLQGTFRNDQEPPGKNINFSLVVGPVPLPDNVAEREHAARIFKQVIGDLQYAGLLQAADIPVIETYALEFAKYWELNEDIKNNGYSTSGGRMRPEVKAAQQALENILKMAQEYGLTPMARQKLRVRIDEDKSSKIADLLIEPSKKKKE